jgi:hypothetical protein
MSDASAAPASHAIATTTVKRGSAKRASKAKPASGKRSKYNARGEHVNGVWMASGTQAERYRQLLALEKEGKIGNLRTEIPFPLVVNNVKITMYRLDFMYDTLNERGQEERRVYEEVKGFVTPQYRVTKKLFEALQQTKLSEIFCSSAKEMSAKWAGIIPD